MVKLTISKLNMVVHTEFVEDWKESIYIDSIIQNKTFGDVDEFEIDRIEMSNEQVEALEYLNSTDWYIIRANDPSSNEPIPAEVLDARANAREIL